MAKATKAPPQWRRDWILLNVTWRYCSLETDT